MKATTERHLGVDSFTRYLRTALPLEHPVPGDPRVVLFFDPQHTRVGLRGPAARNETASDSGLANLTVRTVHHQQGRMIEIAVDDPQIFIDAYPVLCAVADRVQLDGQTMTAALTGTLRRLGHLLKPEDTPSHEFETGMIGELRLLAGLVRTTGPTAALQAWRGGQPEEHDFGLPGHDVEVKTTTSEHRVHWIASLTQLVPTGDRPLWLVSMQITRAGLDGVTLSDLVIRVRDLYTAGDAETLDQRLHAAGWRDSYATHCHQRWRMRTPPAVFAATDGFPRLTPDVLTHAGAGTTEITDVQYRIDVTARKPDTGPPLVAAMLAAGQQELP